MYAVIFDIDGTLVDSCDVDYRCYKEAVTEVVGPVTFRDDWHDYPHVTDPGCLLDILADNGIDAADEIVSAVKARFVGKIRRHASGGAGFTQVPGAAAFVTRLRKSGMFALAFATGGWRDSAAAKLRSAGVPMDVGPLCSADDHHRRADIMRIARSRLPEEVGEVIYYGDAPWDLQACAELGWRFRPVGSRLGGLADFADEYDALVTFCARGN